MANHARGGDDQAPTKIYFNPARTRRGHEELFDIGHIVDDRFDPSRPMGNVAACDVDTFVDCILVGLWPRVADVVPQRIDWLDRALVGGERFGESPAFHRATLLKAKALCLWLLGSKAHQAVWPEALDAHQQAMSERGAYARRDLSTLALDEFMVLSLLSRQPERGIAMHDRMRPGKPLPTLQATTQPRNWAYWACLRMLGREVDAQALLTAGRRMLRLNLDDPWLGRGQVRRAAMWLMAVYWLRDSSLTPAQTLLKAYDDLPGVTPPQEVLLNP